MGAGLTLGAVLGTGGVAQAAVFEVENLDASGEGSLREAIADANAIPVDADVITFQSGLSGSIQLGGTALSITSPLQVVGSETGNISIDAEGASRVVEVDAGDGDLVRFANVGIFSGSTADPAGGGGIRVLNGDLTLDSVRLQGHYATGNYATGGALLSTGADSSITVTDSEVNGRAPDGFAGAIAVAGGDLTLSGTTIEGSYAGAEVGGFAGAVLFGGDEALIERSTISGNEVFNGGFGGGIVLGGGTMTIESSTITNNHADGSGGHAGGISIPDSSAVLNLDSTIVSNNTSYGGTANDLEAGTGVTVNATASLIETTPPGTIDGGGGGNIFDENAGLEPLEDNGGPTPTHALGASSAAIDQGTGTGTDQRDATRPVDDPAVDDSSVTGANGADIGAFELQASGPQEVTNLNDAGTGSLRGAMFASNDHGDANAVSFQSGLTGTIPLTSGEIDITEPVNIQGPGADVLTVSGSDSSRIFDVDAGGETSISGLTLSDGEGHETTGGAIRHGDGDLTVADSELTDNHADGSAGGAIASGGSGLLTISGSTLAGNSAGVGGAIVAEADLDLERSTISGNDAIDDGGGIYFRGAYADIHDSTISGNGADDRGGGVYSYLTAGDVDFQNSIVAGNTDQSGDPNVSGDVTASFSLFGPVETVTETVPGSNLTSQDPQLQPLALNGGTTRTHALASTSPAIDKASSTADDQRGIARPLDYAFVANSAAAGGNGADIGAFELTGLTGPVTPVDPTPVTPAPDPAKPKPKKCKKPKGKKKKCKKKRRKK